MSEQILKASNPSNTVTIRNNENGTVSILMGEGSPVTIMGIGVNGPILPDGSIVASINSLGFRNKILNGAFRVNQRGAATKTTTASAYNYDRWYYDGTYLYQGIENLNIEDGTYGISWTSNATCQWALVSKATAAAAVASGWSGTAVANGSTFTVSGSSGKNLWVRFANGGDGLNALNKVQVELGGVTPFESRPYGLELSLCQRYYEQLGDSISGSLTLSGYAAGASTFYYSFPFKVRKIFAPTCNKNGTWTVSNAAQPEVYNIGLDGVIMSVASSGAGVFYALSNAGGNSLTVIAEL